MPLSAPSIAAPILEVQAGYFSFITLNYSINSNLIYLFPVKLFYFS